MKTGHCKQCPKYPDVCRLVFSTKINELVPDCPLINAELQRVTNPRRAKRIEIIFENELTGPQLNRWNAVIYGVFSDPSQL